MKLLGDDEVIIAHIMAGELVLEVISLVLYSLAGSSDTNPLLLAVLGALLLARQRALLSPELLQLSLQPAGVIDLLTIGIDDIVLQAEIDAHYPVNCCKLFSTKTVIDQETSEPLARRHELYDDALDVPMNFTMQSYWYVTDLAQMKEAELLVPRQKLESRLVVSECLKSMRRFESELSGLPASLPHLSESGEVVEKVVPLRLKTFGIDLIELWPLLLQPGEELAHLVG